MMSYNVLFSTIVVSEINYLVHEIINKHNLKRPFKGLWLIERENNVFPLIELPL
jgi:hypothetical protein